MAVHCVFLGLVNVKDTWLSSPSVISMKKNKVDQSCGTGINVTTSGYAMKARPEPKIKNMSSSEWTLALKIYRNVDFLLFSTWYWIMLLIPDTLQWSRGNMKSREEISPEAATFSTSLSRTWAICPRIEKITKPAKKLVTELPTDTINVSLQRKHLNVEHILQARDLNF